MPNPPSDWHDLPGLCALLSPSGKMDLGLALSYEGTANLIKKHMEVLKLGIDWQLFKHAETLSLNMMR